MSIYPTYATVTHPRTATTLGAAPKRDSNNFPPLGATPVPTPAKNLAAPATGKQSRTFKTTSTPSSELALTQAASATAAAELILALQRNPLKNRSSAAAPPAEVKVPNSLLPSDNEIQLSGFTLGKFGAIGGPVVQSAQSA